MVTVQPLKISQAKIKQSFRGIIIPQLKFRRTEDPSGLKNDKAWVGVDDPQTISFYLRGKPRAFHTAECAVQASDTMEARLHRNAHCLTLFLALLVEPEEVQTAQLWLKEATPWAAAGRPQKLDLANDLTVRMTADPVTGTLYLTAQSGLPTTAAVPAP